MYHNGFDMCGLIVNKGNSQQLSVADPGISKRGGAVPAR